MLAATSSKPDVIRAESTAASWNPSQLVMSALPHSAPYQERIVRYVGRRQRRGPHKMVLLPCNITASPFPLLPSTCIATYRPQYTDPIIILSHPSESSPRQRPVIRHTSLRRSAYYYACLYSFVLHHSLLTFFLAANHFPPASYLSRTPLVHLDLHNLCRRALYPLSYHSHRT